MLIAMKKQEFDLLTANDLSQGCFVPLIKIYKRRVAEQSIDDPAHIKEMFYKQLNKGQQALFMFYTYYNHASKSPVEFYWWSAYFMAQRKSWSAIKSSAIFFEDESLLQLLEMIEIELKRYNHPETLEYFTITRDELNQNHELQASIYKLHSIFDTTTPLTIRQINKYIEKNLKEFVQIVD
ncbi:hypothetical protein [Bacillus sp. JJ722]|uniref:hypothetical protein n=1 Tax=Bacillus sp. JJ722 TaxID=3122973 RepID=UPI002FFE8140